MTAAVPVELPGGWEVIGGALNGGALLRAATTALGERVPHPDPVTVTGHFLGPGRPGPATLAARILRRGGRHSTAAATLRQDGHDVVAVLATFGDLAAVGPARRAAPDLPPPEACVRIVPEEIPGAPAVFDRIDVRLDPRSAGFLRGAPTGRGEMAGWVRVPGGTGTAGLVLLADVFPPAIFDHGVLGWVPTVELTVHCRRRPPEGWIAARFRTRHVTGPYLEEDGELWDAAGNLLALSRQLALAPR